MKTKDTALPKAKIKTLANLKRPTPSVLPMELPVKPSVDTRTHAPPKAAMFLIKIARLGKFKDEWEEFFQLEYEEKLKRHDENYARTWAYRYAVKTVFFALVEVGKLVFVTYWKIAGK